MTKGISVVLSGSGLRYPVFGGALHCLVENGYAIERIAGVSGGAIVAAAVACGYTPGQPLKDLIMDTLPGPNGLFDWSWLPFIRPKHGAIWGRKIRQALAEQFVPFFRQTEIPLSVVTCNLSMKQHRIFSTTDTPDMDLALAVRMSMSLPGFDPVEYEGDLYMDGGIAANYPLDIFGTGEDVIGLRFRAKPFPEPLTKESSRTEVLMAIVDTLMESTTREHVEDAVFARQILLDTDGGSLDFDLNRDGAERLWLDGYESTRAWLKEQA